MKNFEHFTIEWQQLHQNIEQYERLSIIIKLVAFVFSIVVITNVFSWLLSTVLLAVLWLQDGILKTFQSRLEQRIQVVEMAMLSDETQDIHLDKAEPFQLYSQWQENKPNAIGLISQYISNSLKPTVMYPYVVLMVLLVFC